MYFSADGCFSSLPAVSLAHACCCAPVHAGAHALPPILLLACALTGSGLAVSSCSCSLTPPGAPCSAHLVWAHAYGGEEGGLLWGLRLFAVDVIIRLGLSLARSFWAQACLLSFWGSPVLIWARAHSPWCWGSRSLACSCACAHTWLTLKSSPHWVVAAAAAPDTSSLSATGPGRVGKGKEGKGRLFFCR